MRSYIESYASNHTLIVLAFANLAITAWLIAILKLRGVSFNSHSLGATAPVMPYQPAISCVTDPSYSMVTRPILHTQVESAIEGSLRADSVLGVVVVRTPHSGVPFRRAISTMELLSSIRQIVSRPHFVHLTGSTIAIVVPRLKLRASLEEIANRIRQGLDVMGRTEDGRSDFAIGTAMYPIDGYDAQQLIESAQTHLQSCGAPQCQDADGWPSLDSTASNENEVVVQYPSHSTGMRTPQTFL
jgi:hypothetical protein